ncbi:MAG TPA: NADH-quinone oxidoreductase subunit J [Edaphocola sp.]|nr:NADH-quinone oxidoreductase subunit J [Edaphocola sp.]
MSVHELLFWLLSLWAIVSASFVVLSRNPINSVLWLISTFFALSGHYILMNAQFIAIVNIIVYAGAIMVLFLFVLMLLNLNTDTEPQKSRLIHFTALISAGSLLLIVLASLRSAELTDIPVTGAGDIGLIEVLGKTLFNEKYVLPFELSSVLFLSAMVGAMVLGRKDPATTEEKNIVKK